jgi:hypothetical protein
VNDDPQEKMTQTLAGWEQLKATTSSGATRLVSVKQQLRQERREQKKIDGRTLRKTGRTEQLNVRVRSGTKEDLQKLAQQNNWLIAETLEQAIAALREKLGQNS